MIRFWYAYSWFVVVLVPVAFAVLPFMGDDGDRWDFSLGIVTGIGWYGAVRDVWKHRKGSANATT